MYGLFNTHAFTVVSNKSFYCVVGFDIIQAFHQDFSCDLFLPRS